MLSSVRDVRGAALEGELVEGEVRAAKVKDGLRTPPAADHANAVRTGCAGCGPWQRSYIQLGPPLRHRLPRPCPDKVEGAALAKEPLHGRPRPSHVLRSPAHTISQPDMSAGGLTPRWRTAAAYGAAMLASQCDQIRIVQCLHASTRTTHGAAVKRRALWDGGVQAAYLGAQGDAINSSSPKVGKPRFFNRL